MGAAESRSHLEESTSVPVLTINGEIDDETGREAGFASEVTAEQAARRRGLGLRACSRGLEVRVRLRLRLRLGVVDGQGSGTRVR